MLILNDLPSVRPIDSRNSTAKEANPEKASHCDGYGADQHSGVDICLMILA